jgi:hypothetical protein
MPCYLFTYHAYGSWMPDHRRGYVRRGEGIVPSDPHMAACYRANLKQSEIQFSKSIQREVIEGALEACREWQVARKQIRSKITRRLNAMHKRQNWFSKSLSRKQVKDRAHFDYLIRKYLPRHSGLKWSEPGGVIG